MNIPTTIDLLQTHGWDLESCEYYEQDDGTVSWVYQLTNPDTDRITITHEQDPWVDLINN